MKFILRLTLVLSLSLPLAAWGHGLCEKAGVSSLSIGSDEDICLKETLTEVEFRTLEHITQIHAEVAALFQVEVQDLFSRPLTVSVSEYIFGPFVSSASAGFMNVGVYPADDFKINTGAYLHELGHVLAGNRNTKLPEILADLDHSVLFSETFADLLALTVHGHIITPSETPNCLDRLRFITDFQTYQYPQEYFGDFSSARLMKCCDSLIKTTKEEKFQNFCTEAAKYFSRDIQFSGPFDPLQESGIDDHQVGIPFLSFLKDFAQKTSSSWKDLFKKIIFNSRPSYDSFTCSLLKGTEVLRTDRLTAHTARNMIQDLKATLSDPELELFEKLFDNHVIGQGLLFSDKEAPKHLEEKYKELIRPSRDTTVSCHK